MKPILLVVFVVLVIDLVAGNTRVPACDVQCPAPLAYINSCCGSHGYQVTGGLCIGKSAYCRELRTGGLIVGTNSSHEIDRLSSRVRDLSSAVQTMDARVEGLENRVDAIAKGGAISEIISLKSQTFQNRVDHESLVRKVDEEKRHNKMVISTLDTDLNRKVDGVRKDTTAQVNGVKKQLDEGLANLRSLQSSDIAQVRKEVKEEETKAEERMVTMMQMFDEMKERLTQLEDKIVAETPEPTKPSAS